MSKTTTIEVLLTASGKGLNSTFKKAEKGVAAFNKTVGKGTSMVGDLRTQLLGMAGALVGFHALGQVGQMLQEASVAGYNLEASLKAANRQFEVGSADEWTASIDELSETLRIYSKADIQNATARTIDMTKRLGLSADQMERVIELSGDLAAGKTTLEGGVERVTAALRGEAEASEYLGLTLGETYVKAWHEAHNAHEIAWKDLSDLEKNQVRYNIFLEQSLPLQGRASESVKTYAGAIALIKKEVSDGIAQNDDLVESLNLVATVLNENSEELGKFAGSLASGAASVIEFVANNRELLKGIGKWALILGGATKVITTLITLVRGLNAAILVMSGANLVGWGAGVAKAAGVARAGVVLLAGTTAGLTATLLALPAAAAFAAVNIAKLVVQYRELKKIEAQIAAQESENKETAKALGDQYAELSEKVGLVITSKEELTKADDDGLIHYDENIGEWVRGAKTMADATTQSTNTIKQVTGAALDEMKAKYKAYADEVKRLQDQIAGREASLAEQLRSMGRTGMSDLSAWKDRKAEAEEYAAAAEKAMEAGDHEGAAALADKARTAYADLNKEVKEGDQVLVSQAEALEASMTGVESAGKLAVEALKRQQTAAADAMEELDANSGFHDLSKGMDAAEKKWLDNWNDMRKGAIDDIEAVEDRLLKIEDKEVTVWINEKVKKATGGPIGFRTGGKLGGYGGGDRIPALLEAGEFIIRKEAVSKFGAGIFHALNSFKVPQFAVGGAVGAMPGGGQSVTINLYDHVTSEQATLVAPTKNDYQAFERMQRRNRRLSSQ